MKTFSHHIVDFGAGGVVLVEVPRSNGPVKCRRDHHCAAIVEKYK